MRNRQGQNASRKKHREENLDLRNAAGYFDMTAYIAAANIKRETERLGVRKVKEMKI